MSPKLHVHLEAQNVILLGNRTFAAIVKLETSKWDHGEFRVNCNPSGQHRCMRRRPESREDALWGGDWRIGPPAEDTCSLWGLEVGEGLSPERPEGARPCWPLILDFCLLELWRSKSELSSAIKFLVVRENDTGRMIFFPLGFWANMSIMFLEKLYLWFLLWLKTIVYHLNKKPSFMLQWIFYLVFASKGGLTWGTE